MKILKLIALLAAVSCFSCSSGEPESIASVDQALVSCSQPNYVHAFNSSNIISIRSIPPGASCPAIYTSEEPLVWSLSLTAPPPRRADGKCSCSWVIMGQCYNDITGEGISINACYGGACNYFRKFVCRYRAPGAPANDCSYPVTYSMEPVTATGTTGNWNHTKMWLTVTEPGCTRMVEVNDFHVLLP